MTTAVSANAGAVRARRSSVVLPLPRKPVKTVTGRLSAARALSTTRSNTGAAIVSRGGAAGKGRGNPALLAGLTMGVVAFSSLRQHHACHGGAAYAAALWEERA